MDIQLIAMDLDGTALCPDHASFTPRLEAALLEAHRRGVSIVPATGRQYLLLPPPIQAMPDWADLVVLCNGAEVRRLRTGEIVSAHYMAAEELAPLIRAAEQLDIPIELSVGGTLHLTQACLDRERTIEGLRFHLSVLEQRGRLVEDMESFAAGAGRVFEKANLLGVTPAVWKELSPVLETLPLSYAWATSASLEVTCRAATKAEGIRTVCRLLGVDMAHVMALGDSGNDISSLTAAGLGVAMGSAPAEVKAAADAVTASNAEDGAALAIERYVLDRETASL